MLCAAAHSTQRCRAELWAAGGSDTLLDLLHEPVSILHYQCLCLRCTHQQHAAGLMMGVSLHGLNRLLQC